uniref:DYW domain-containing protein n=1 Tax=Ananas comosus var. bracteatus TaxID=296719 RepID=A0A6V7QW72_ANACO
MRTLSKSITLKPLLLLLPRLLLRLCLRGPLADAVAALPILDSLGLRADPLSYSDLIKLCLRHGSPDHARLLHRHLFSSHANHPQLFLSNSLISMYVKFGLLEDARDLFDQMPQRNVVSWTTMISALANLKEKEEALRLFIRMQRDGISPNMYTFSSVLRTCNTPSTLWSIHSCIIKYGLDSDVFVRSSLIDIYSKLGDLEYGYRVFSEMVTHDLVVWNSIIGCFAQSGEGFKALELFAEMKKAGFLANQGTLTSVLRACTGMVLLEMGRQVHVHVLKYESDLILNNALLDMYCKCGSLEDARGLFDRMLERDVISWSTMISGLAQNGRSIEALKLFESMKLLGVKPNHITILGVLFACSHAGLVEDGWYCFNSMEKLFGVEPGREHYGCMVDLLCRAGKLKEAVKFIQELKFEPDLVIWRTVLGACRVHRNINLATYVAKEIHKLEPEDEGTYILLSNIYANSRRWGDVELGTYRTQSDRIVKELNRLISRISNIGYVPDIEFVLQDLGREQKEESLRYHSEKLAVAFGMLNSTEGKPIRIMKNLRICGDCHTFAKLISKAEEKLIVIRDPVRFHYFKDGFCSCGDYW